MVSRKASAIRTSVPASASIEDRYPTLAAWVQDGWIEIGRDDCNRSFARALDIGGMVFEGKEEHYASLDDVFADLDAGIAAWADENGVVLNLHRGQSGG